MEGDTINITLQVSEQIENSTLQILSTSINMSVNDDTASANVTVLQNSSNGPVAFNIMAYDKTGNVFDVTQDDITGNNVVIDTNNPSLADLSISSNNTDTSLATVNNNLTITITANETLKAECSHIFAISINDGHRKFGETIYCALINQNTCSRHVAINFALNV